MCCVYVLVGGWDSLLVWSVLGVPHFQCSHQKEAASVAKTAVINMQRVALFKKKTTIKTL